MTYTPDWERLSSGLNRMIAAGLTKEVAQRELCSAIADGKISMRGHLAAQFKLGFPARTIWGAEFPIPARLSPADINWRTSRPRRQWALATPHAGEWGMTFVSRALHLTDRTVELIEVRARDVTKLFCGPGDKADANPTPGLPGRRSGTGSKSLAAKEAIIACWPEGVPGSLSGKDRNNKVVDWARANGRSVPSKRGIERALNELKKT